MILQRKINENIKNGNYYYMTDLHGAKSPYDQYIQIFKRQIIKTS